MYSVDLKEYPLQCTSTLTQPVHPCRYRELHDAFTLLQQGPGGSIPVMALTATATMRVRKDIVQVLGLGKSRGGNYHACTNTFHRENLYFAVHHTKTANLVNLEADLAKYLSFPASHRRALGFQSSGAPLFAGPALISSQSLRGCSVLGGPAVRAAAAANARAAGSRNTGESGTLAQCWSKKSKSAPTTSPSRDTTDFPATLSIKCPMCDADLMYPDGASPDMVVGAHLDTGCGTSSLATAVSHAQGSIGGLRGGGKSRRSSTKGKGLYCSTATCSTATSVPGAAAVNYIGSEDDDDVPIVQLTPGRKRARQTAAGEACLRQGAGATNTITISDDSKDSSDDDEIEISGAQEGRRIKCEQGVAEDSDDIEQGTSISAVDQFRNNVFPKFAGSD